MSDPYELRCSAYNSAGAQGRTLMMGHLSFYKQSHVIKNINRYDCLITQVTGLDLDSGCL